MLRLKCEGGKARSSDQLSGVFPLFWVGVRLVARCVLFANDAGDDLWGTGGEVMVRREGQIDVIAIFTNHNIPIFTVLPVTFFAWCHLRL